MQEHTCRGQGIICGVVFFFFFPSSMWDLIIKLESLDWSVGAFFTSSRAILEPFCWSLNTLKYQTCCLNFPCAKCRRKSLKILAWTMAFAIGKKLEGVFFFPPNFCFPLSAHSENAPKQRRRSRTHKMPSSVLPTDSSLNPESAWLGFPYFSMVGESSREG